MHSCIRGFSGHGAAARFETLLSMRSMNTLLCPEKVKCSNAMTNFTGTGTRYSHARKGVGVLRDIVQSSKQSISRTRVQSVPSTICSRLN